MISSSDRDPLEKIYNDVAQKYDLTYSTVREIHRAQFAFIRHVMETSYDAVRFMMLGTFYVHKWRKHKVDENYAKGLAQGKEKKYNRVDRPYNAAWEKMEPIPKEEVRELNNKINAKVYARRTVDIDE